MKQAPEHLLKLIEPVVEGLGYECVGVEYNSHPKHGFLRIFIDIEQGVGMEDCSKVSHQVSGVLDVEGPIAGEYNLEVSSPGMDRPLFKLKQFEQFIGHTAQVNLFKPVGGRRKITGLIEKVEDNNVYLQQDGQVYKVPFQAMSKAKLEPDYSI
ncbi:ribosome maturation factor RimP [Bathymodiolus japonicus methanotrophic gill symbiont]|uniref:ribosome maturation factor RimP n=1 Tax=Bathymodiolus japonicus methanotrophic gill symbiont TaxID=113269 RepID=UPI001B63D3A7|nr:ribosome maturation factor RimP [Bathymodiolus japonicus methanotrophic gill symbiont]GFO72369.1 ribosome maturation factor RimP [Bathymodiolus japonicus methanotrophic gill symbiont]